MEMSDLSTSLVTSGTRATIPHRRTKAKDDLPVRRGWFGRSFSLAHRDWKVLQATIDRCKAPTSWSTTLGFNFSWKNPFVSSYLQRGVNLAAITFSYFSGVLPFSPKIAMGASTAWEGVQWGVHVFRLRESEPTKACIFPILGALIVFPVFLIFLMRYLTEEWVDQNKDREDKDYTTIYLITSFQTVFLINCIATYLFDKPEHDFKLQLENLQELLQQYPALETNLELRHNNPEALDNAFVDNEGKPILSPFYQVIEGDTDNERQYLKLDELYTLIKTKDDDLIIYCDRKRFEKVLTIFKNAQAQNA